MEIYWRKSLKRKYGLIDPSFRKHIKLAVPLQAGAEASDRINKITLLFAFMREIGKFISALCRNELFLFDGLFIVEFSIQSNFLDLLLVN